MRYVVSVTAAMLGIGVTSIAGAQDVRVRAQVTIRSEITREIVRQVSESTGPAMAASIRRAVLEAVDAAVASRAWGQISNQRDFKAEAEERATRTLPLGANGSLELRNIIGDISVTAGTGRDTTVEIIRHARALTDADAKRGLQLVTVEVDQRGDRATLRPVYPTETRQPYSVSVSYHVTAPAGTHLSVNSLAGDVSVRGIRGDVGVSVTSGKVDLTDVGRISNAKTISGDITITGADMPEGSLTVGSMSGNLTLQQIKARRIEASTISGEATARNLTVESATLSSTSGSVDFSGPLSRSGRYELTSHSGHVRFTPSGPTGFELQANTFAGTIRTDLPMQMQGNVSGRGPRRTIRATSGDASAVVVLTTFSGNIVIGK